ncbi:hypothetical protein [Caballeronia sp. BR00000012568055]|uniref:hypothetical protein n=1 Tax=Caballeronia sp. BR00000012568055 TaxID=2918761 RepID=UPI0023FA44BF|nr:hypothetical protein [Caballeronia sp. BR00000012568055]
MLVTFDLRYATTSRYGNDVYRRITNALQEADFFKYRKGKSEREFELPSNTYIAELELDDDESSSSLLDEVRVMLKDIFEKLEVDGRYFVMAGKRWAWVGGKVSN